MSADGLRQRISTPAATEAEANAAATEEESEEKGNHPGGDIKHGAYNQAGRVTLLALYFLGSCLSIFVSQVFGSWLYFYNRQWYYSWMAVTKQHFVLLITCLQQLWAPITVRVSWDQELQDEFHQTEDGRLETNFPERLVMIANHQIYIEWLYLWWMAYTSRMHGHIYIILKESLRHIPVLGWGMQFYSFIFMSRKWETDKSRLRHRLQKLIMKHSSPEGKRYLNPMWLLIFPEGTNLSLVTRERSTAWAKKSGQKNMRHQLLPRSTGLLYILQELRETVDYVYDCTIAYEGVPRGEFAQDIFTLRGMYLQGRLPSSVNLHWRRFATKDIPLDDIEKFNNWLMTRWYEKDALLEEYLQTGRFTSEGSVVPVINASTGAPSAEESNGHITPKPRGYIETEVKSRNQFEFLQIFLPCIALILVLNVVFKFWRILTTLM